MEKKRIVLFDVDGVITPARKSIEAEMRECLLKLHEKTQFGFVGGSDAPKAREQVQEFFSIADYTFTENGLVAFKKGELFSEKSIKDELGEENLQKFINFVLKYLSGIEIPIKRGTFIEYRKGMLNISPIGRNCSREERNQFEIYDKEHGIRKAFVEALNENFADFGLQFSIGGQISFDVFPKGWDKSYCLQFLEEEYGEIHFFGDKTFAGGNDYEIFIDKRTIGHSVENPQQTIQILTELFELE